jgi:hypothetical protein
MLKGTQMDEMKAAISEKRSYIRIVYNQELRPILKVKNFKFEVDDLSESGIRFVNSKKAKLYKDIQGVLTFLYGESIVIKGSIVWQENSLIGLLLKHLIPPAKFLKEQQHLILTNK